jgi:hypothetical protein
MVAKVKNLCTEEKPSFAYLCICVQANKITALTFAFFAQTLFFFFGEEKLFAP